MRTRTFLEKMGAATELLQASGPAAATAAIQLALRGEASAGAPSSAKSDIRAAANVKTSSVQLPSGDTEKCGPQAARRPMPVDVGIISANDDVGLGQFRSKTCTNRSGSRNYKLYIPNGYRGQALPLIVMLHGCKQSPDDFAAGTRMNIAAEERNCFVVYPAQVTTANISGCWNWFLPNHQQRDLGEPSIIADITRNVMRDYAIDRRRVYVAGLSAGGAMAAVMATTYPELWAAVGLHSGLPYGAAHDVMSAFMAMKNGASEVRAKESLLCRAHMPIIIFHGDDDTTVNVSNAEQALTQFAANASGNTLNVSLTTGRVTGGRAYTRTTQITDDGNIVTELWIVQGGGHAWSGGSEQGSYTDPCGPDATRAMVDFFFAHAKAAA